MNVTGAIFGVIAVAWLAYLVPMFLRRHAEGDLADADPADPFSSTVTIVRKGTSLAETAEASSDISTPLTRRATLRELTRTDRRAASRRRVVLIVLLAVLFGVSAPVAMGLVAWWAPIIPAALLAGFLVVARFSVRTMRRDLDERARQVSECGDEQTVAIGVQAASEHDEASVELSGPIEAAGSLWDPIPITAPTYVSKPLAPRTVRTIDLSAPLPQPTAGPVVAEAPEDEGGEGEQERRAIGE